MLLHRGRSKDAFANNNSFSQSTVTPEHSGLRSAADENPRRSSTLKFFSSSATPQTPKAKDAQRAWTAEYLNDLRSNRPARPSGSRPFPGRNAVSTPTPPLEHPVRTSSAMGRPVCSTQQASTEAQSVPETTASALSHGRAKSAIPTLIGAGRPLVHQPQPNSNSKDLTTPITIPEDENTAKEDIVDVPYLERGLRWMEKQEARSLRAALEVMDARAEKQLHEAAQDEATDLVWKHHNPGAPYRNPDVPFDLKSHLRKGSHARSLSTERYASLGMRKGSYEQSKRSTSDGSINSKSSRKTSGSSRVSSGSSRGGIPNTEDFSRSVNKSSMEWESPKKKSYMNMTFPMPPKSIFSGHRRISGPKSRKSSAETRQSLFRNPEDQIYEEPEAIAVTAASLPPAEKPLPLRPKARNLSVTFKEVNDKLEGLTTASVRPGFSRYEIHKNPPSQSRNPSYLRNTLPATPPRSVSPADNSQSNGGPGCKNGKEIRGEDIRAATSMKLKDRSPKLPTPTVVSDRPSRPIVSFDRNYKPREVELKEERSLSSRPSSRDASNRVLPNGATKPHMPASTASAPVIPTISISESPTIQVNDKPPIPIINIPDIPSISLSTDTPSISVSPEIPTITTPETSSTSARPLPNPSKTLPTPHNHRPTPYHSATAPPPTTTSHWSPSAHRATAQCSACALPIAGRIVSALSQRFHPACFSCHQCGELLECVAFYPEPAPFRESRLARIHARLNDLPIPAVEGMHTEEEDGDSSLRFYCHLDFHEKFSPRCRSCKTPIEGEVVLACGGEWHVGHFFCAECGDPFDAMTPFVEKDGFAWCVGCHCKRFSGKCAGCRKPITETVVKALGREWHEGCFCCKVCWFLCRKGSLRADG